MIHKMAGWLKIMLGLGILSPLVMVAAGLAACKPKEIELAFETLVQGEAQVLDESGMNFVATYENTDLMIATDRSETQQIADTLSPGRSGMRFEKIMDVNYGEYLVVVAYLGAKPHAGFVVAIERIAQTGRYIDVAISTVEPEVGGAAVVHPIHAIKIKRADLAVKGNLTFRLWKEDEAVLAREHFVR